MEFGHCRQGAHEEVAPDLDLEDLNVCRWKGLAMTGEGADPAIKAPEKKSWDWS